LPPLRFPDKVTAARHRISEAGAIFPSACARAGASCSPHPLFPPLSRGGRGGKQRQGEQPFAPTSLSHIVGEGQGARATKNARTPHAANSSDVPLSALGSPREAWGTKPIGSPCLQGEPVGGGSSISLVFVNFAHMIGITPVMSPLSARRPHPAHATGALAAWAAQSRHTAISPR
jgi:hypothetical protein